MKKNCFLYTVFLGTIIIGSAIYFFQNHFSEIFFEEGKKIVVNQIEKNWDKDLNYVKNSIEKDSVRTLVKEFVVQFKNAEEFLSTSSTAEDFAEAISSSFDDSLITANELKVLSDLFLKVKNEKLKSD
jgi:hypothetical protein